jgi:hypothetical protein
MAARFDTAGERKRMPSDICSNIDDVVTWPDQSEHEVLETLLVAPVQRHPLRDIHIATIEFECQAIDGNSRAESEVSKQARMQSIEKLGPAQWCSTQPLARHNQQ